MFLLVIVTRMPRSAESALHLGLDLARQVDLGEADVAVLVALDILQLGQLRGIELLDQALGQHRDAEVPAHRAPLDDRALDDVADGRQNGTC